MQLGASFSHPWLKQLNLDPNQTIKEFKKLGLAWIRLGCYWNEIESTEGKFNFKTIESFVQYCEENKINVLLTVGIKAPRYPEYYLPSWITRRVKTDLTRKITYKKNQELVKRTLLFIEKTVERFKKSIS